MVLGATNRPSELDEAILRRFSQSFEIGLPDEKERAEILKVILHDADVEGDIDFEHLASLCKGYSGSDLCNVCKEAAYLPIKQLLEDEKNGKQTDQDPRPLSQQDLEKALKTTRKTSTAACEYSRLHESESSSSKEDVTALSYYI